MIRSPMSANRTRMMTHRSPLSDPRPPPPVTQVCADEHESSTDSATRCDHEKPARPKRLVNRQKIPAARLRGYPEAQETAGPSKPKRRSRPMPDSLTRKALVRGLPDPWVRGPIPYIDHANGRFSEVKFSWVKPGVRHVMAHPAGLKIRLKRPKTSRSIQLPC